VGSWFWMVLVGSSVSCGAVPSHCGGSVRVLGGLEVPVLVRPGGSQRFWLGTGVVLGANRLQYHSSTETPMINPDTI